MHIRGSTCGKMLLTALLLLAWAADGHAYGSYGKEVDDFCPSRPYESYVGADSCLLCHVPPDRSEPSPAKDAFNQGNLCYFCPEDPPCVPDPVCTDADGDGYAVEGGTCGAVDCDDGDPDVHPGVAENCTDGIDNDCDGMVDAADPGAVGCPPDCTDADGDLYSVEGGACGQVDCNDTNASINPGAAERCTDGVDNNCNGLVDAADPNAINCPPDCTDADGDGYSGEGGGCGPVDCDDADPSINPGAAEDCKDGVDNNCDGLVDADDPAAVGCVAGCTDADGDLYSIDAGDCGPVDCDDANVSVHPGAAENCTDGIDNDCDGLIDEADPDAIDCPNSCTDTDGDGYAIEGGDCGPVDCDDGKAAVNPGAKERCTDGLDNDCDGMIDQTDPNAEGCLSSCTDADGDGYAIEGGDCGPVDCNDRKAVVNPGAKERCRDGRDNDCNGRIDRKDRACRNRDNDDDDEVDHDDEGDNDHDGDNDRDDASDRDYEAEDASVGNGGPGDADPGNKLMGSCGTVLDSHGSPHPAGILVYLLPAAFLVVWKATGRKR